MKIDNAQLAAFAAVLAEGSFEGAARRLHVTTSAVSQRLRLLEERLGQILLRQGEQGTHLMYLLQGQVEVLVKLQPLRESGRWLLTPHLSHPPFRTAQILPTLD